MIGIKEALIIVSESLCNDTCFEMNKDCMCATCRKAYDMLEELCEKATPKKPLKIKRTYGITATFTDTVCPTCKTKLLSSENEDYEYYEQNYCDRCGQSLNWEE